MKKFAMSILALVMALVVPISVSASGDVQLGPGEWDTLYYNDLYLNTSSYNYIQVNSGGGNLEICVYNMNTNNNGNFIVYESDGSTRDFVALGYIS
ncbi:hypothetical protein [Pseudalkalibacillus hwajinpoensis]|uniref:Uncharacterized protein n=1 Tax=Guptibacillus hwajinpoensis TaxID=208199 RepID=A0A4U1MH34_9BACL|nr:hypothetical protein [Pseudalkalibacillus hwajinpoensis]TKD69785.1 hypothetical protein FBF83_10890 [Pseudalkalibacillus hwajinpoensis]